jgi:hypothetical protein
VDPENCDPVSTLGITELFSMEKKCSEITLELRGKRQNPFISELLFETEAVFLIQIIASCF